MKTPLVSAIYWKPLTTDRFRVFTPLKATRLKAGAVRDFQKGFPCRTATPLPFGHFPCQGNTLRRSWRARCLRHETDEVLRVLFHLIRLSARILRAESHLPLQGKACEISTKDKATMCLFGTLSLFLSLRRQNGNGFYNRLTTVFRSIRVVIV